MKFEYKIEKNITLEELNFYGADGWELVSILETITVTDSHEVLIRYFYLKKLISSV